jgi:hypothetical protein
MAVIDAALGGARDGRGSVLLIEGGAGLGKSRLLEETVRLAGRAGVRAAVGRADVDDNVVPMAPLMAACFGGNAPLLDRDDLSALRAPGEDRYWVLLELEAQLERAARDSAPRVRRICAMRLTSAVAIPRRLQSGPRTGSSSSAMPPASAQVAKPTSEPCSSATYVRPSASPRGSRTRCSGWASRLSRSPALDKHARR